MCGLDLGQVGVELVGIVAVAGRAAGPVAAGRFTRSACCSTWRYSWRSVEWSCSSAPGWPGPRILGLTLKRGFGSRRDGSSGSANEARNEATAPIAPTSSISHRSPGPDVRRIPGSSSPRAVMAVTTTRSASAWLPASTWRANSAVVWPAAATTRRPPGRRCRAAAPWARAQPSSPWRGCRPAAEREDLQYDRAECARTRSPAMRRPGPPATAVPPVTGPEREPLSVSDLRPMTDPRNVPWTRIARHARLRRSVRAMAGANGLPERVPGLGHRRLPTVMVTPRGAGGSGACPSSPPRAAGRMRRPPLGHDGRVRRWNGWGDDGDDTRLGRGGRQFLEQRIGTRDTAGRRHPSRTWSPHSLRRGWPRIRPCPWTFRELRAAPGARPVVPGPRRAPVGTHQRQSPTRLPARSTTPRFAS